MGIPLYSIRDIRTLYGMDPRGNEVIDFDFASPSPSRPSASLSPGSRRRLPYHCREPRHWLQARHGCSDRAQLPFEHFHWGYFSVGTSGALHEYADSQFGHIFAYGADRSEARKQMVISLKELSIRGDFRTTVEYLIKLLETDAFESNKITTGWLDGLIQDRLTAERPPADLAVICGAAVKAHLLARECEDEYKRILNKGQVPLVTPSRPSSRSTSSTRTSSTTSPRPAAPFLAGSCTSTVDARWSSCDPDRRRSPHRSDWQVAPGLLA